MQPVDGLWHLFRPHPRGKTQRRSTGLSERVLILRSAAPLQGSVPGADSAGGKAALDPHGALGLRTWGAVHGVSGIKANCVPFPEEKRGKFSRTVGIYWFRQGTGYGCLRQSTSILRTPIDIGVTARHPAVLRLVVKLLSSLRKKSARNGQHGTRESPPRCGMMVPRGSRLEVNAAAAARALAQAPGTQIIGPKDTAQSGTVVVHPGTGPTGTAP